jgi:hypothetical protein
MKPCNVLQQVGDRSRKQLTRFGAFWNGCHTDNRKLSEEFHFIKKSLVKRDSLVFIAHYGKMAKE